jgi:HK97 family phage major capsid protein
MQIKLLQDFNGTVKGSLVEVDDVTGVDLISKQIAEIDEITKEQIETKVNEIVQKTLESEKLDKQVNIRIKNMENDKFVIGKMFQHIAKKTITGNSETSSAADGGNLVVTGIAELAPLVMLESKVYAKCRKVPVSTASNAMKVAFDASATFIAGSAAVASNPAEGVAGTATKLVTDAKTLTLTKTTIPIYVTEELLEDAQSVDAWIRGSLVGKMANVLDAQILASGAGGFEAVIGATGYTATQSISATPTLAEVQAVVSKVHPNFKPEFYMSITLWNLMVGTFGTASNIMNQLIDISGKKLLGIPVNVMPFLSAAQLVLGDFSQYTVIEASNGDSLKINDSVRFMEGEVIYKLQHRGAGAICYKSQATGDSLTVSAFVQKA